MRSFKAGLITSSLLTPVLVAGGMFAQAGPADPEYFNQFTLRRQPITRTEIAGTHKFKDAVDYLLSEALLFPRLRGSCSQ